MATYQMDLEWKSMIRLLAQHLYTDKRVFARELLQNAHDAIKRRVAQDPGIIPRIEISANPQTGEFEVRDNGIGMDAADLKAFLSTLGASATRLQDEQLGLIGRFGIGFLSAFVVADEVVVRTRKVGSDETWLWRNAGSRDYVLERVPQSEIGTIVTLKVSATDRALLAIDEVRRSIALYCDMLPVPIYLNKAAVPINRLHMPWERDDLSQERRLFDCRVLIAEINQDEALELIPFATKGVSGLLYVTKTRVLGVPSPRSVRVMVKRMFVSANLPDVLPDWAVFVNGILNFNTVLTNASRDNVVRDSTFHDCREELGRIIIKHLEQLKTEKRSRFSRIQTYHRLALEAACHYYDAFFDSFIDLIEWPTNQLGSDGSGATTYRSCTLPEILTLNRNQADADSRNVLRCLTSGNASLFFKVATASGRLVIDANSLHGEALLRKYRDRRCDPKSLTIRFIDRESDDQIFAPLESREHEAYRNLCQALQNISTAPSADSNSSRQARAGTVEVRRFLPPDVPALLVVPAPAPEIIEAMEIASDPNSTAAMRLLAQALLEKHENATSMILNAGNSVVRRAALLDLATDEGKRYALGIFNSAFLSSGMLTPANALILHDNLTYFMESSARLRQNVEALEHRAEEPSNGSVPDHMAASSDRCLSAFLMIPFSDSFLPIVAALRQLLEDQWGVRLFVASDKKYEDRILDSIKRHMNEADLFIADITGGNPNVMLEVGAVLSQRRGRALLCILNGSEPGRVPADLGSFIYHNYAGPWQSDDDQIAHLDSEFRRDVVIERLLAQPRDFFVSARAIRAALHTGNGTLVSDREIANLAKAIPSARRWEVAQIDEVTSCLAQDSEREVAELLLSRVRRHLKMQTRRTSNGDRPAP